MTTQEKIIIEATRIFADKGYSGISMRTLANKVKISPSVLYHYYPDKETLLRSMFDTINTKLGEERKLLPVPSTAREMLQQRIIFQLDNAEEVVTILKYYLAYRKTFKKIFSGFIPEKGYLHIQEVLEFGNKTGEFAVMDIRDKARVITHAINGFILEYYPAIPKDKEKEELISTIHTFLIKAIEKGGEK